MAFELHVYDLIETNICGTITRVSPRRPSRVFEHTSREEALAHAKELMEAQPLDNSGHHSVGVFDVLDIKGNTAYGDRGYRIVEV